MAEVVHPDINSQTYEYCGIGIKTWNKNSNILAVLNQIVIDFNKEAPIPA
jgi:hypothetical protein